MAKSKLSKSTLPHSPVTQSISTPKHSKGINSSSSSSSAMFIAIGCVTFFVLIIIAVVIYLLYFSTEKEVKPANTSAKTKHSIKAGKTAGKTKKVGKFLSAQMSSKMFSPTIKGKNKNSKNVSSTVSFKSSIFGTCGKYSQASSSVVSEVAPSKIIPSSAHIASLPKQKGQAVSSKVHLKVAAPPSKMDARFGSMNSKLLLDVEIDQPSKSALDTPTAYSGISKVNSQVSSQVSSQVGSKVMTKATKPKASLSKISHKRSSSIG